MTALVTMKVIISVRPEDVRGVRKDPCFRQVLEGVLVSIHVYRRPPCMWSQRVACSIVANTNGDTLDYVAGMHPFLVQPLGELLSTLRARVTPLARDTGICQPKQFPSSRSIVDKTRARSCHHSLSHTLCLCLPSKLTLAFNVNIGAGGVAAARRIAAESVADERREVAELALREAEAKLRHSTDLSLRTSLDHRPLANPRSLIEEGATTTPSSKVNSPVPGTGDPAPDRAESRGGNPYLHGNVREDTATEHPIEPRDASQPGCNKDGELARTGGPTLFNSSSCPPSSSLPSRGYESDNESHAEGVGEAGRCPDPGLQNDQGLKTDADDRQHQQQEPAPKDGLRELKREISDLEGKILGRLGGGGGDNDDRPTESYPSGDRERSGNVAVENFLESSARGMATRHGQRQQQQQRPPPSRIEAPPSTLVRRSVISRPSFSASMRVTRRGREAKVLPARRTRADRDPEGVERTRCPQTAGRSAEATSSCPDRVRLSWDRVSAISSAETSASGRSGGSRRGDLRWNGSRSNSFAAR